MVIEVEILVRSMPSKRRCMSSMESMATPTFPTSPDGQRVIGVETDLRGQIEGDREPGGAVRQQVLVALVRFLGVAEAGVLAHGPEPAAVHGGLHAAGKGIIAGVSDLAFLVASVQIGGRVERADGDVGGGLRDQRARRFRVCRSCTKGNNHQGHEGSRRNSRGSQHRSGFPSCTFVSFVV